VVLSFVIYLIVMMSIIRKKDLISTIDAKLNSAKKKILSDIRIDISKCLLINFRKLYTLRVFLICYDIMRFNVEISIFYL